MLVSCVCFAHIMYDAIMNEYNMYLKSIWNQKSNVKDNENSNNFLKIF